jgi:hypothetical protein
MSDGDDRPPTFGDQLLGLKNIGRAEAEQLYMTILDDLEKQIAELKSKFKNQEAFDQFLAMLHGKKVIH